MARTRNDLPGLCDLHSHILPGVDDGCRTVEESRAVLRRCVETGIEKLALTPHFYPEKRSLESFLERRAAAFESLREAMGAEPCPQLILGAEVSYYPGLLQEERIEELCLGASNYLLLEMPFSRWTPGILRNVRALRHEQGVIPILAHVERYMAMNDRRTLDELLDAGVLMQMNGECILDLRSRRKAMKMIRKGLVDVLGSDCHGYEYRPPNLAAAWKLLTVGRMAEYAGVIGENMQEIFEAAE